MKTLRDLFEYQLQDLYNAEEQLADLFNVLAHKVTDHQVKEILEDHVKETKEHLIRLETICDELEISVLGNKCHTIEGLVKTVYQFLNENMKEEVFNIGLVALVQNLQYYEISRYTNAVRFAKELGLREISNKLQLTLNEDYETGDRLSDVAEDRLSRNAIDKL